MNFGERLRYLRNNAGLTQKEVGVYVNKGESTVRMWELNKSQPDKDVLKALAKLFDVTVDYLVDNETETTKKAPSDNAESAKALAALRSIGLTPADLESLSPDKKQLVKSIVENFMQDKRK